MLRLLKRCGVSYADAFERSKPFAIAPRQDHDMCLPRHDVRAATSGEACAVRIVSRRRARQRPLDEAGQMRLGLRFAELVASAVRRTGSGARRLAP